MSEAGQSLTLKALAFYMVDLGPEAVKGETLSNLGLRLIRVPEGAILRLEDVTIVMGAPALDMLLRSLGSNVKNWPYDPTVVIEGGSIHIANLTSTGYGPPGPDGTLLPGGRMQWVNVTLICPILNKKSPPPLMARAVVDAAELYEAARRALVEESATKVFLSLTADHYALPSDGSWQQMPLGLNQQLVLLGNPSRTTTLDLSGIAEAWTLEVKQDDSGSVFSPVALLSDLLLINLPYPSRPNGPMSMLSVALHSFGISRGTLRKSSQIRLVRSTIVVPDPELKFLAEVAAGGHSNNVWPGQPATGFDIAIASAKDKPTSGSTEALALLQLSLMSEVELSDCTLLSASSYEQLPDAVQLLPQSRLWLPELLAARDPDTVVTWGYGGLSVAPGLQQALTALASCDSPSLPADYNPVRLIWGSDDHSVPPLGSSPGSTATITLSSSRRGPLASSTAASTCAVDGSSTSSPLLLPGSGSRVFSDLRGAIGRFTLLRRIALRNLVLYNLAPGGIYPSNAAQPPPSLRPVDSAWENSSLPLWFFGCARSDADLRYSQQPAADDGPLGSLLNHHEQLPLLLLENVVLVVPEREWRALAAAVLQQHAPEALADAQRRRKLGQQQARTPQHQALAAGPPAISISGGTKAEAEAAAGWRTWPNAPSRNDGDLSTRLLQSVEFGPRPPNWPRRPLWPQMPPQPPRRPRPPPSPPPRPPPPPLPSPPPSFPSPPPLPPHDITTRSALLSFAAKSRVLSYDYSTGELVLAVARHYGWYGTNVTIKHKMPPDTPTSAHLLSYPDLALPYNDLADLDIDVHVDFSAGPTADSGPTAGPSEPISRLPDSAAMLAPPQQQLQLQQPRREGPTAAAPTAPSSSPGTSASASSRPSWVVPLAASVATVGGVLLILAAVLAGFVLLARRQRRREHDEQGGQLGEPRDGLVEVVIQQCEGSTKARGAAAGGLLGGTGHGCQAAGTDPPTSCRSPLHGMRPPDATATGASSSSYTITSQSYRTALARALEGISGGPSSGKGFVEATQRPGTAGASGLKNQQDGGGCPLEGPTCIQAANRESSAQLHESGTGTFLREMNAYFLRLDRRSTETAAGRSANDVDGEGVFSPESSQRQPRGSRDMQGSIQKIQAELRDPNLHLEDVIGCGAFGVVYRGLWRRLPVAVKTLVVSQKLAGKEGRARQRAVLEAAISMSMAHPNVVATYTYDIKPLAQAPLHSAEGADAVAPCGYGLLSDGEDSMDMEAIMVECDAVKLYIVQEYCSGGTMQQALERGLTGCVRAGGLPGLTALRLALDVARGMAHIHSCRIVHGDLKPDNVLLVFGGLAGSSAADEGQSGSSVTMSAGGGSSGRAPRLVAKVADFGLSTRLPEGATHASHCFQGTPTYLAPEVASAGQMSPRADVWAFGLMLLELYFGCPLQTVRAIYAAILRDECAQPLGPQQLPPAKGFVQDILASISDPQYADLVGRCLSLEPRGRPTFEEVVAYLSSTAGAGAGRQQPEDRHGES